MLKHLIFYSLLFFALNASATSYYCDPVNGNINNDGSEANPWSSLADVVFKNKTLVAGDIIYLLNGDHGRPYIGNYQLSGAGVTVMPLTGHNPLIVSIQIANSSYWTFEDLFIEGATSNLTKDGFMVISDVNSNYITFKNCTVQSAESSVTWKKADWYDNSIGGFDMRGEHITIESCTIKNTYHALSLRGNYAYAANNLIDNFAGDAMRGHGDFSTYEYNIVRDCYINDYAIQHDDAFQAFRVSGQELKIEGVIIRNNKFLLFEDEITQFVIDNDLIGSLMQGIILTDGYADGWVIENNLVVNDQSHGISLYGPRNCRVQNNTVVQHPYYTDTEVPWIYLDDNSKTGQSNFDNIIRNNITTKLTTWTYDATSIVENNIDIDESNVANYEAHFIDYSNKDFHLKQSSTAVDYGANTDLPSEDLDGLARVFNGIVDAGAYEFTTNDAPVLANIIDQTVDEGVELIVTISATDTNGDALSFVASNLPSFGTLVDNGDNTATITFLPLAGGNGIYTDILVTVSDGTDSDSQLFTLIVGGSTNTAPVLASISNKSVNEKSELIIALSASDADGDMLTYSVLNLPSFATLTDSGDGTATLTVSPLSGDAGNYSSIEIMVSDGQIEDVEIFDLEVVAVINNAPTLSAISDQSVAETEELIIQIMATDIDGDNLAFSSSNLPAFATLTDNGDGTAEMLLKPQTGDKGVYSAVKIEVTDGGEIVNQTFALTVQNPPNQAPTLQIIDDQVVQIGETLVFTVLGSDVDGDNLSFTKFNMPSFGSIINKGGGVCEITLMPQAGDYGSYSDIKITVSDGVESETQSFGLTVNEIVLGVEEIVDNEFSVFPNPSENGVFTIVFENRVKVRNTEILIYSTTGILLHKEKILNHVENQLLIEHELNTGIYLLVMINDRKNHKRVISIK